MKKGFVALFILVLVITCFCVNIVAAEKKADVSVSKGFQLSKTDLAASGYKYNYTSGNATVNTYVQHWKGNFFNRDTARTEIKTSSGLSKHDCTVIIYVDGKENARSTGSLYAETPTVSIWQKVSNTYHSIETTSSNGKTYLYEATGKP